MQYISPGDRVVVLGGSGFIGSHLIPALLSSGMSVVNFDIFEPTDPLPTEVEYVRGDIRNENALATAFAGADAVVNLAAAHHDFGIPESTFESVNIGGARAVTAAMTEAGIKNLCFYSSVAVYGDSEQAPTETSPTTPTNIYGRTKLEAEGVYRAWADSDPGRRALIVRPAVVFGPRNAANMYRLIDQIARRRFLSVGNGANEKSMVYVENIVQAIMFLWQSEPKVQPEIVNCVDEPNLTSAEIIRHVYTALGRRAPRFHLPLAPAIWLAKPLDLVAKLTKRDLPITSNRIAKLGASETAFSAHRLRSLGFTPEVPLRVGITRMVNWYQDLDRDPSSYTHIPPEEPVTP